jgi:similar to stage IV sporulation protein
MMDQISIRRENPMLIKLLNWVRGILWVQISGTAPERFINLCCNKKIFIWNLIQVEHGYQFCILARNYKKLKSIARKTKIVPKIKRKRGLVFILHRYKKRTGFFTGLILCMVLIYVMSLNIWDISILGGSKYTPETMLKFLNQNQVYTGILKRKVDCQEIEETIRLTYKDIGWVSAEIRGTRLIIKITETNMPAPARPAMEPSHITATKDAIVKKIITRSGTPMVKEGDVVKKGDILISGIITITDDFGVEISREPVVADADIRCSSFYDYKDIFSMNYTYKNYTGKSKKGYYITFFGRKLFLYNPSNSYAMYDIIVDEKSLHITDSFYLPLKFGRIETREYMEEKRQYTEEEARSIATERLKRYFDKLTQRDVLITENSVKITIEKNKCITSGRILVEEPAWEYTTIQENEWRIEPVDEHNGDNH